MRISPAGRPRRKRFIQAAFALSVWIVPFGADSSPPKRSSDRAYGTESAIEVVRKDRLILGPATRICVATTVDPEARRIVEASGQPFDADVAEDLTRFTTGRLSSEFRDRGWSSYSPRNRILAHIEHKLNPRGCFDRPDTILVRHNVARGKSPRGYAVRLTATQGGRAYEVAVERPHAVTVSDEIRSAIDYRSNYVPGTQRPYWDPLRDSAKLSDMFIRHLLKRGPTHG